MAGTSKIRSICVTTTADEDETSEGNPENSKRDAVTLQNRYQRLKTKQRRNQRMTEPATAEPATAEPTTAEPARRGPAVQELDLTFHNPTDRALFQLGTLPTELRTTIIHHGPCRPKEPFAISSENGNRRIYSGKNTTMHVLLDNPWNE